MKDTKGTTAPTNAHEESTLARKVWENLQLLNLAMTIAGQVLVGGNYLIGQGIWFVANVIALVRDFVLKRPVADKIKNTCMTALTAGLIAFYLIGGF